MVCVVAVRLAIVSLAIANLNRAFASPTNIIVAHHSATNRTAAYASLICSAAAARPNAVVRCKPVTEVTCEDLKWMHGLALGSPVFWGTVSGVMKSFLDDVQNRCFGWPVRALRWRVGAAFSTGAHLSSGKEATIQAVHSFYIAVQMVIVGNEAEAACMVGACATNHNESATEPEFTESELTDASTLAQRLVAMATAMKPLMTLEPDAPHATLTAYSQTATGEWQNALAMQ